MRNHAGFQIINKHDEFDAHRCGFCGEISYTIDLVTTSRYGNNAAYGPKSDFAYFTDISKRTNNNLVLSNPCSNRPVHCELCETVYWSYNLASHYLLIHPGIKCPEQISKKEFEFIKIKKI